MSHNDFKVQSIAFNKDTFSLEQAITWVLSHGYKFNKIDETNNQLRFRQFSPDYLKRLGFSTYVTKDIGNGVQLILIYRL